VLGMMQGSYFPNQQAWVQPGACKAMASRDAGVAAGTPAASMNEPSTSPLAQCRRLKMALALRLLVRSTLLGSRLIKSTIR
jgi:hypothetical protein